MPGEKTQAVWDYSEHATITQGQLLEKSSKNAIFLKVMWKTPLFKRLSRLARARESGIVLFCAGRATPQEIWRAGPMVSGTDWRMLQQRISRAAGLEQRGVGVAFPDAPPPDLEEFEGTAPSGCSFWRLAAAGRSFHTVPRDHFNCAVGAHTHNIPLPCGRERNRRDAPNDVRSGLCEAGRGGEDSALAKDSGRRSLRSARLSSSSRTWCCSRRSRLARCC